MCVCVCVSVYLLLIILLENTTLKAFKNVDFSHELFKEKTFLRNIISRFFCSVLL